MLPQRPSSPVASSSSLPPDHFLALQPSFSQPTAAFPSGVPSTSSHQAHGLAPNTASLASADFEVDVRTGFLPGSSNVERLSGKYEVWEEALDAARGGGRLGEGLIVGGTREKERLWRKGVQLIPVLDTDELRMSLPLLRRAHIVLTFLAHFYAHTTPTPSPAPAARDPIPVPACISVPLLTVSPLLGLPPILTYADTVLYNFLPANPTIAPSNTLNPPSSIITTFTNTRSEEQFFLISALTEIAGAEALRIMRQSLDELFIGDEKAMRRLTVYLKRLAMQIDKISDITMTLMKEVDPEEFYHLIRPWFRGGDADGPQSAGWDYMGLAGENGTSEAESASTEGRRGKMFSGPSAGQSSLIHAIDIFLTVDHSPTPEERAEALAAAETEPEHSGDSISMNSAPVSADAPTPAPHAHGHGHGHGGAKAAPKSEASFLQRMLQYMPLPHRTFLLHLSTHPTPLRPLVVHYAASHPALAAAYDGALESLRRFREKHMRVVSLFIVQQARRKPSERVRKLIGLEESAEEEEEKVVDIGEIRGTGGTALFKFLKRCRDNTTRAMVRPSGAGYELE
ncbi:hypothetical protein CI109_102391 [Kwoniella shandongensis]|uniref:Tryptophan 2,3-dioxygenase n=1 Tax=Kwoniella shandongensis TaxID=1734106 RepID=A0A5M6C5C8_9TREE|nr:uncharacterized protein CI109_003289 [Kwoniella shandongensis]KAA5528389.1 hypothetical protein CI109_003289 [Kwoniella shandongensis]